MIGSFIALLFVAQGARPPQAAAPALPPQDWSTLPPLALRRPWGTTPETAAYVRDEVLHGRCAAAVRDAAGWTLEMDMAVLTTAEGRVRRIVPRAIRCPTIEQYAAGLVSSGVRDNLDPRPGDSDRWFRMHVTFVWAP